MTSEGRCLHRSGGSHAGACREPHFNGNGAVAAFSLPGSGRSCEQPWAEVGGGGWLFGLRSLLHRQGGGPALIARMIRLEAEARNGLAGQPQRDDRGEHEGDDARHGDIMSGRGAPVKWRCRQASCGFLFDDNVTNLMDRVSDVSSGTYGSLLE